LFSGGTAAPHNYKGIAYDGELTEASAITFAYDLHHGRWETVSEDTDDPRVDSHLLDTTVGPVLLGGMAKDLAVTARVTLLPKNER